MISLNDSVKDSTTMVSIMCASFSKTNFFEGFYCRALFIPALGAGYFNGSLYKIFTSLTSGTPSVLTRITKELCATRPGLTARAHRGTLSILPHFSGVEIDALS